MTVSQQVRRCRTLYLEPRQVTVFQWEEVLAGGTGLGARPQWLALAPHLDTPVLLSEPQVLLLGRLDAERWMAPPCSFDDADLAHLLGHGLVLDINDQQSSMAAREAQLRNAHWWGPAAMAHWQGRWRGQDSVKSLEAVGLQTAEGLRSRLGPPPPERLAGLGEMLMLPHLEETSFDQRLRERSTCRNYDTGRPLPIAVLSRLLQRALGETGRQVVAGDAVFLKKNAPSAGGLHPTEAYVLAQHVEGITPGLYHYDAGRHGLCLVPGAQDAVRELALQFTAGQHWFADAHVLVVLAPRFARTYWKYQQHAKAYRAVVLDVGHLSQLLLTCATEEGLGGFITAAINEQDIEQAIGMDPMLQSPLAICGAGWRAHRMATSEFDPGQHVWERVDEPGSRTG